MNSNVSIIIPAHNESKVIGTTLDALLPGLCKNCLEVIVVCNGCSDGTVDIVKSLHNSIVCIETPVACKSHALNLGDEAANHFPRIYQDADVVLSMEAIEKIARFLIQGKALAVAPKMRMQYSGSSWAVRSYYDIWQKLPYVQEGMVGVGVYALSKEGRQCFGKFPEIIADDGYVRAMFKSHERTVVQDCYSEVRAPKNLNGLLKIKTRSRRGRYELATKFPELINNEKKEYGKTIFKVTKSIFLWPKIAVYLYVNIISRLLAYRQIACNNQLWERDESSRDMDSGNFNNTRVDNEKNNAG